MNNVVEYMNTQSSNLNDMPDLSTKSRSSNLEGQDVISSYETDSSNSEIQWGNQHGMSLMERELQLIVGISESRSEIEIIPHWIGNLSSDSRKTQHFFIMVLI